MKTKALTIKELTTLVRLLGFRGLVSYRTLYGKEGNRNTFGYRNSSVWVVAVHFKFEGTGFGGFFESNLIRSIEVNTLWQVPPAVERINKYLADEGAKEYSEVIKFLTA